MNSRSIEEYVNLMYIDRIRTIRDNVIILPQLQPHCRLRNVDDRRLLTYSVNGSIYCVDLAEIIPRLNSIIAHNYINDNYHFDYDLKHFINGPLLIGLENLNKLKERTILYNGHMMINNTNNEHVELEHYVRTLFDLLPPTHNNNNNNNNPWAVNHPPLPPVMYNNPVPVAPPLVPVIPPVPVAPVPVPRRVTIPAFDSSTSRPLAPIFDTNTNTNTTDTVNRRRRSQQIPSFDLSSTTVPPPPPPPPQQQIRRPQIVPRPITSQSKLLSFLPPNNTKRKRSKGQTPTRYQPLIPSKRLSSQRLSPQQTRNQKQKHRHSPPPEPPLQPVLPSFLLSDDTLSTIAPTAPTHKASQHAPPLYPSFVSDDTTTTTVPRKPTMLQIPSKPFQGGQPPELNKHVIAPLLDAFPPQQPRIPHKVPRQPAPPLYPSFFSDDTTTTTVPRKPTMLQIPSKPFQGGKPPELNQHVISQLLDVLNAPQQQPIKPPSRINRMVVEKPPMCLNEKGGGGDTCAIIGNEQNDMFKFMKYCRFDYMIKGNPIGEKTTNGFNFLLDYSRDYERTKLESSCVLKSSLKRPAHLQDADNLLYEYLMGLALNRSINETLPFIVCTHGLFAYKSDLEYELMFGKYNRKQTIYNYTIKRAVDLLHIKNEEVYDRNLVEWIKMSYKKPTDMCILIEAVPHAVSFFDLLMTKDRARSEEIYMFAVIPILFQVYGTLYKLREQFSHYDLHLSNILITQPPKTYFTYTFNTNNGTYDVDCFYMIKIIDFGRSYCKGVSEGIVKDLCKSIPQLRRTRLCDPQSRDETNLKGYDYAVRNPQDPKQTISVVRNISTDLLCLKQIFDRHSCVQKLHYTRGLEKLMPKMKFDYDFTTREMLNNGYPNKIHNIIDAFDFLTDLIQQNNRMYKIPKKQKKQVFINIDFSD